MMQMTPIVKQLLVLNIIMFLGSWMIPTANDIFALHYWGDDNFRVWQLVTHMFMHGGVFHIFFNMFALVSFGSVLEHYWGARKFLFFYFSCGLGAAALQLGITHLEIQDMLAQASSLHLSPELEHTVLNLVLDDGQFIKGSVFEENLIPVLEEAGRLPKLNQAGFDALFQAAIHAQTPMVGASGAIYGLLVAFAFMFPMAELAMLFIPIPIKAKYFVPGLITLDILAGINGSSLFGSGASGGVAHFAHIGGAVIGFIIMWSWRYSKFGKNNRWN